MIITGLLNKLFSSKVLTNICEKTALVWIDAHHFLFSKILKIKFIIDGIENLDKSKSYLVIANHPTIFDPWIIEEALYETGLSRFFVKKSVLMIPFLGWALQQLHFPSMFRKPKNRAQYEQNKKTSVLTCSKLQGRHFKLVNFCEGTRFSKQKHSQQKIKQFQNLLPPKIAGLAYGIEHLHHHVDGILDITIIYSVPEAHVTDLLFGNLQSVKIIIHKYPITPNLIGQYDTNKAYRQHLQQELNKIWLKKDYIIEQEFKHNTQCYTS